MTISDIFQHPPFRGDKGNTSRAENKISLLIFYGEESKSLQLVARAFTNLSIIETNAEHFVLFSRGAVYLQDAPAT